MLYPRFAALLTRANSMLFVLLAVCLALSAVSPAHAHRQKMGMTQMSLNARTGMLEIAHQFNIHDAEHAVLRKFGVETGILGDATARDAFARYVASEFRVTGQTGPLEFVLLGAEIEGAQIWIYQEAALDRPLERLQIDMSAMHDIWPDHVNLVNWVSTRGTQSLLFEAGSSVQSLSPTP